MTNNGFRVIDAEPHFEEPYDLWERHLPEPWRSRTRIIPPPRGHLDAGINVHDVRVEGETLIFGGRTDGNDPDNFVQRQATRRWPETPHLAEARVPHSRPEVYIEGFDIEGVDTGIMMPTTAGHILEYQGFEPEHAMAVARVYNEWAHAFCATHADRFGFWGLVTAHDSKLGASEARRCMKELGAVGITICKDSGTHLVNDDRLRPVWEELDELHAPVAFHGFGDGHSLRGGPPAGGLKLGPPTHQRERFIRGFSGPRSAVLAGLIFGGILDQYPHITPVFMESGVNGVLFMLEQMEERWWLFGPDQDFEISMSPRDYYRTRCYGVTFAEALLKYAIDYLGDENFLFSTDYPHHDAPFPNGVQHFLDLEGVSEESKRKILWDNPAKLFGIEVAQQHCTAGGQTTAAEAATSPS